MINKTFFILEGGGLSTDIKVEKVEISVLFVGR